MKLKKIGILFSAVALSVLASTTAFAKNVGDYRDVGKNDWFYPYVEDVSAKELMTGTSATAFSPTDQLARGQLATIIYRMHGAPETAFEARFPDVSNGVFYSIPITWANTYGVIKGYDNGTFGPENPISRQELATMLYRYAVKSGYDTTKAGNLNEFPDAGKVAEFAKESMEWATGAGIITGDGGRLNPQGTVNRAVGATMISRFHGIVGGTEHAHTWIQQFKTVTDYKDQPVYEDRPVYEQVPVYGTRTVILTGCGVKLYSVEERINHALSCPCGYSVQTETTIVGYEDKQVGTEKVQVGTERVPSGSHQEPDGYACSCGARK